MYTEKATTEDRRLYCFVNFEAEEENGVKICGVDLDYDFKIFPQPTFTLARPSVIMYF